MAGIRPLEFDQEAADKICTRIAAGESLRSICRDDDMPGLATALKWLDRLPHFVVQYTRAREVQADTLFDDILSIADDARNDWMDKHGSDDAGWQANGEHLQRSRLRIDSRKWMAGKMRPKKYGDAVKLDHTGIPPAIGAIDISKLSPEIRDAMLAAMDAKVREADEGEQG